MRLITLLLLCLALAGCAAFDGLSEGVSGISDYFMGGRIILTPRLYWLSIRLK